MRNFKFIEILISLVLSILTFAFVQDINGYGWLFILPVGYTCCCIFSNKLYEIQNKNIAVTAIHCISFIKYDLVPCIIAMSSDYYNGVLTGQIPAAESVQQAIIYTLYEMLTVFSIIAVSNLFSVKNINKKIHKFNKRTEVQPIISFVLILGILFIIIFGDYLLPKQIFLLNDEYVAKKEGFLFDGAVLIIYTVFKLLVLIFSLRYIFELYENKKKYRYIVFSGLIMILYLGIQTSTSRWNMLIPVIIYLYLAAQYFKEKIKAIAIVVGVILAVSIVSISAYKFSWLVKKTDNIAQEIFVILTQQVQEYFSGPRAIAQGIESIEVYKDDIKISTFFNDYLGSIPLLSHYIEQKDRINVYYNYYIKGVGAEVTQIMPMITIGIAYFGEVFSIVFIVIHLVWAIRFGEIENKITNIFYKYIYMYASMWFSMALMFNTQIIFGWFISNFIPFVVVLAINDIIVYKRKEETFDERRINKYNCSGV